MANKMDTDRVIHLNLPYELEGREIKRSITKSAKPFGIKIEYSLPPGEGISVNLKDTKTKHTPSLGIIKDQKGHTYFKDKQSVIYYFNKKLNAFCLAPQPFIIVEKLLGIDLNPHEKETKPAIKSLSYYTEKYLDDFSENPTSPNQVVSKNNISDVINNIFSASYTEIHLYGNLDFLVPYIQPTRHCSINIYSSPGMIKHRLVTRKIGNNFFFDIKIKNKTSRLFYDLFVLATRKVVLNQEYEVPFDHRNAPSELFKTAEFIKTRLETYYELLMFGIKYSNYLFEDGYNTRDENLMFSHQEKINEICTMLKKIESQFFCFEISNEYLFTQLETMPPASLTDLALLQKEAFEETSLIISAFFDLIKSLLKFKPKEESINGKG